MSALEALTNAVVGILVSYGVTLWLLPIWGLQPAPIDAAGITWLYFWVSFLRSWAIREIFRRAHG
jgi:hypothetical protein